MHVNKILLALLLLISPIFITTSYSLTERYVDNSTGDDADDGTTEGLAWKTIQHAADTATAGMRVNIKDTSTYVITNAITLGTNSGTQDSPIVFQGYTTTIGDGGKPLIDANDGTPDAANVFNFSASDWIYLIDIEAQDSTSFIIATTSSTEPLFLYRIKLSNAGTDCFEFDNGLSGLQMFDSEITGCSDDAGEYSTSSSMFAYNNVHDTGEIFNSGGGGATFYKNIFDTLDQDCLRLSSADYWNIHNNTFYNCTGDGLEIGSSVEGVSIVNNIFQDAGGWGINNLSGSGINYIAHNDFHSNTSGTMSNLGSTIFDQGGEQNLDPQFTDAANQDFNIGSNLDDLGFPTTFIGATSTTGNAEMGVAPYEETGGGACTTVTCTHFFN